MARTETVMSLEEKIRALPPDKQVEVEDFVNFLFSRTSSPARAKLGDTAGLRALFGTIDYDPEYDYKAARRRDIE